MARRPQPTLLGVLKPNEDAPTQWITTVWRLPSGGLRQIAQKTFLGPRTAQQHAEDMGGKLVDAEGNEVNP